MLSSSPELIAHRLSHIQVRRAAVSQLTALATAMEGEVVGSFHASIMPLLVSMSGIEHSSISLLRKLLLLQKSRACMYQGLYITPLY